MADRLKIAFFGTGAMAGHHLQALGRVAVPHRIVGVHDRVVELAETFALRAGCPAYPTPDALWSEARPDVVHVCTPPHLHFEPAASALEAGAHVYVEKPFVQSADEAARLLATARRMRRLVCPGFQQLRDPTFDALMVRAGELGAIRRVDCRFYFNPARFDSRKASSRMLVEQMLDVLPHPLYTLIAVIERLVGDRIGELRIDYVRATPTDATLLLSCGPIRGELEVSLELRPVRSSLLLEGQRGALAADFVRGIVHGVANDGTQALEKMLNPFVEGAQLQLRSAVALARRLFRGQGYPGLAELIESFYAAVRDGSPPPLEADHVIRVVEAYEGVAARARSAAAEQRPRVSVEPAPAGAPTVLVTGAGGLLGAEICRALAERGIRVRGLGRSDRSDATPSHEWVTADLAAGLPPEALDGTSVVVHAAAETRGGKEAHRRNSVDATRLLIQAMAERGVVRLVLVSSIAVLEPRWWRGRPLDEEAPLADRPESLGPYIWGKCTSERLVADAAPGLGVEAKIVRPAALYEPGGHALPGRLGRRLIGRWYLCLGRPGLPFAACPVRTAAQVVAWYAQRFEQAPRIVNLVDPATGTRGELLAAYRAAGWGGRPVWAPISLMALVVRAAGIAAALARGGGAGPSAWKVLKPRRYRVDRARDVIGKAAAGAMAEPAPASSTSG